MTNPNEQGDRLPLLWQTPAAIKAKQSQNLQETLALVQETHPFYRERWDALGIDPASVKGVDDLSLLPLTRKSDFMSHPERFRLDLSLMASKISLEKRLLWEVMYTTGTSSGSPSVLYASSHDHYAGLYAAGMVADFHNITERDVVANLYPLTSMPMGAFIRVNDFAFASGASVIVLSPGKPYPEFAVHRRLDETIALVAAHRATVLVGVATFIRRFVVRAQELGVSLSSVRRVLLGGEAAPMDIRSDIEDRLRDLGAKDVWVTSRYGSTEMGTLPECSTGSGWHNPAPDLLYLEVVDDDGTPLPEGSIGQLAITHLNKTGTVLLRYLVGDETSINNDECPHCGRSGGRVVSQPKRVSALIKVRGTLINPAIIQDVLASTRSVEDHQAVISKTDPTDPLSMDAFTIRVIPRENLNDSALADIALRIREAVGITPNIEICSAEDIFDPQARTKPLRFVDKRQGAQASTHHVQARAVSE